MGCIPVTGFSRGRGCSLLASASRHPCLLGVTAAFGGSPPETPARGHASVPVSGLRCLPVRSLALLFLAQRAAVASVKAGHLAGAPPGCLVVVPILAAALHRPSPVLLHRGILEKEGDVCTQGTCRPKSLRR